ncbi:hypothetical protein EC991_003417 [Linnemannia zychae]|nr:hypothetical protein EC991_003417 [Linnemannia zychae]
MAEIPPEAIGRNCHLLKVLQLGIFDFHRLKLALLDCTNLVELDIQCGNDLQLDRQTGLTESQLLRSNPLLKSLDWTSYNDNFRLGPQNFTTLKNPQDFLGLKSLERLRLDSWDCSNGQLTRILRAVSETLKELIIGAVTGMQPGDFSLPPQQDNSGCRGENLGVANTEHAVLRLERLEILSWSSNNSGLGCVVELVKFCPNLKTLKLSNFKSATLNSLSESLRMHCLHLESVRITPSLKLGSFWNFSRRCSISGLHTLDIGTRLPVDDLISGILYHASTLEDLRIFCAKKDVDSSVFLPLLVGCIKLRRFAFGSYLPLAGRHPAEALKQEKWGCRNLSELSIYLDYFVNKPLTAKSEQEFRDTAFAAGWEMVPLSFRYYMLKVTSLYKLFELLQFQGLEKLQRLVLNELPLRRVSPGIKRNK